MRVDHRHARTAGWGSRSSPAAGGGWPGRPRPIPSHRDRTVIRFPEPAPGEPLTVSATLYRTYVQCPQQALGRLHGEYPGESRASFRGSLAHRLFARHLSTGPVPPEQVEQICRQEIGAALNAKMTSVGILKPSQLRSLIDEVGDLYDRFRRFPEDGFRSAEVALESEPAPGVTLRGTVDAVFDDPEHGTKLIDWKTGADLDDAPTQLEFYAMVWAIEHDEIPGRAEAVSVKTGERVAITPNVADAEATARSVAEMVGVLRMAFRSGAELDRLAGPHCRWCPLLDGCPEGAAATAIVAT